MVVAASIRRVLVCCALPGEDKCERVVIWSVYRSSSVSVFPDGAPCGSALVVVARRAWHVLAASRVGLAFPMNQM